MSYPEFREEIFRVLESIIPQEVTIQLIQAEKLNGCVRHGISFDKEGLSFSPTIYLEPFYSGFQRGKSLETLAAELLGCYEEELDAFPESVNLLYSYEKAKDAIYCKLIHLEENQHMLQDTPHITYLDFAIVAYFEVESAAFYKGSVLIKEHYLDFWEISREELFEQAISQTLKQKGVLFRPMSDVLHQYICEKDGEMYERAQNGMFVLTNQDKLFGAILIYYPEVLLKVEEQLQGDFYLLPASVHEWVIVPVAATKDEELLLSMVQNINRSEVLEEEVLSNYIYRYTGASDGEKITCITGNKV